MPILPACFFDLEKKLAGQLVICAELQSIFNMGSQIDNKRHISVQSSVGQYVPDIFVSKGRNRREKEWLRWGRGNGLKLIYFLLFTC